MDIAVWIVAGLLALAYLAAGLMKSTSPLAKLNESMAWTTRSSAAKVRFVGIVEVLGAVGLILPRVTDILPSLTIAAAIGLTLVQVLAVIEHVRNNEAKAVPVNIVLGAMSLFVAIALLAA